jgi:photosystem II stability/assembly factor-like uncharacterized protein
MLIDAHFATPERGILVGGAAVGDRLRCVAYRTEDGGETLTKLFESTRDDTLCWKIAFPSTSVGYVAIQDLSTDPAVGSTFAKTTDGRATWFEKPLVAGPYRSLGLGFVDERVGWVGGNDPSQPSYRTLDGGDTWQADPSLGQQVNRVRFVDRATGYAIGRGVAKLTVTCR